MKTVVGLFDDDAHAQHAREVLEGAGFQREGIRLMATEQARDRDVGHGGRAAGARELGALGAGIGAVLGAIAGLVVGLGWLAIPALAPFVALGPMVSLLAGAVLGAIGGGLIGALLGLALPPEQHAADHHPGTLVVVRAEDRQARDAAGILHRNGAVDVDERAAHWRKLGLGRLDAAAPAPARHELARGPAIVPKADERLEVGTTPVESGRARVFTHVTEQPVEKEVSLVDEKLVVERHPVDRLATEQDLRNAFEERTFEVTEHAERPVVQKTARVVEEVTIGKRIDQRVETIRDTVKRTDVDVQRVGDERARGHWSSNEADFRSDFARRYRDGGARWDDYEPAYRYGVGLPEDPRYGTREWDAIERDVRAGWERDRPGTWERAKDAIRYAWQRARARTAARVDERRP